MSNTSGRTATTFTGSTESIKFLDNLISNYIGNQDYFSDYFLRLGDFELFKKICDKSWKKVLEEIPKGKKDSISIKLQKKAFFNMFLEQLSNFQQMLGLYLFEKIENTVKDNYSIYNL